jgi:hypothetical protein
MRFLVTGVLVLALLWSGYWLVGSRLVAAGVERLIAASDARGLVAETSDLAVLGFPNRFDLTLSDLRLADPARGWAWEAPFLQIFALTYRPWHLIAAFPPDQAFRTPRGDATLTAGRLQASLRARPARNLPLVQAVLAGEDLLLSVADGGTVSAASLRAASRDLDGDGLRHEIGVEIADLSPDLALPGRLAGLAAPIDRLHLDADLSFDAPLDRFAAARRPALTAIRLREALVVQGDVSARAEGSLAPDAAGLVEGDLTLRLTNWRAVLATAVAAGLIRPDAAQTAERMLALVARQSGDPDRIELTLRFGGGTVNLGPVPLGPAPRFP